MPRGRPTLDHIKALEIRVAAEQGVPQVVLAKRYGVHKTTINSVVKNRSWKERDA